jgi:hypothetical protein
MGLTKVNIHKKAMIAALTKSLGVVTTACKEVGISRTIHYKWIAKDIKYRKSVEDVGEIALDFVETMLHKQIKDKDTAATIFYLKTKGKRRGYVERTEITGADNMPLAIQIEIINSSEQVKKDDDSGR